MSSVSFGVKFLRLGVFQFKACHVVSEKWAVRLNHRHETTQLGMANS